MISKALKSILRLKLLTGIILVLIIGGGYFSYTKIFSNDGVVRYATAQVQNGTLIVSISGSGQVSASNQVDIKPKASGDVIGVYVAPGQEVGAGTVLAAIDASDAERSVRDAETSLETAKLELDKLLEPLDELFLLQAENGLIQAKDNLTKLKFTQESKEQDALDTIKKDEDDIKKAYEDGFNTVANSFLDLPNIMAGLQDILFGTNFSRYQANLYYYSDAVKLYDEKVNQYRDDANNVYQTARKDYNQNFTDYKSASRFSDTVTIEKLIDQTYDTTKGIAEAVKSANNLIQFYQDKLTERNFKPNSLSDTHLSILNTYTGKTNSHLSGLLSIKRSIQDNKETKLNAERNLTEMNQNNPLDLAAAERNVKEKEESLAKLKLGPDDLDIRAKKITVQQREDALTTAKQTLADHYVRAPFAGVIAKVNVKKGDSASAGTAIATVVTKQKIAEVSLNEIDVAKLSDDELADIRMKKIGFVFQSFNLLPRATVLRNVSLPLVYAGVKKEEREKRATEALTSSAFPEKFWNHYSNQLSVGMTQRVAIARALVNNPTLVLADEPTGNLDTKTGEVVIDTFQRLHQEQCRTIVLITHEQYVAEHAQRIIHIRDGEIVSDDKNHKRRMVNHH